MKRNPSTEKGQKNTVIRTDTVMDLIWLIRCALSRTKPDVERVAGMDLVGGGIHHMESFQFLLNGVGVPFLFRHHGRHTRNSHKL